jgi:dUTP pyrophosphatase
MPGGTSDHYLKTDSHFWLMPRSSIYKSGLIMANSVGVIDASYRGELKAPVWSMTGQSNISRGDRLFQIVAPEMGWIRNVKIVESMPGTQRGEGGFGSTGR